MLQSPTSSQLQQTALQSDHCNLFSFVIGAYRFLNRCLYEKMNFEISNLVAVL